MCLCVSVCVWLVCSLFPVDIWSVGCIMGEMVKGSVIFQGTDRILHRSHHLCPSSSIITAPPPGITHRIHPDNLLLLVHSSVRLCNSVKRGNSQFPAESTVRFQPSSVIINLWGCCPDMCNPPLIDRANGIEAIQIICIYIGHFCVSNGFSHLFTHQLLSVTPAIYT